MAKRYADTSYARPDGFAWEVVFPDRQQSRIGAASPKACVVIDGERLTVPVAVAKRMVDMMGDGATCLDRRDVLALISSAQAACANARIVKLASQREYSVQEVRSKLRQDGYWREDIDQAVGRAVAGNVLDDARFADIFIRSKLSCGWGRQKVERELGLKGVDVSDVPGWPGDYIDGDDESERAYRLIEFKTVPSKNPYEKLVRFLIGKGFPYGVAKDAVSRRLSGEEGEGL